MKGNTCKGRCHLKKELEKQEKSESSLPGSLKEKSENIYCSSYHSPLFSSYSNKVEHFFFMTVPQVVSTTSSIFHPPNFLVS